LFPETMWKFVVLFCYASGLTRGSRRGQFSTHSADIMQRELVPLLLRSAAHQTHALAMRIGAPSSSSPLSTSAAAAVSSSSSSSSSSSLAAAAIPPAARLILQLVAHAPRGFGIYLTRDLVLHALAASAHIAGTFLLKETHRIIMATNDSQYFLRQSGIFHHHA
jgi:hypothetical protein